MPAAVSPQLWPPGPSLAVAVASGGAVCLALLWRRRAAATEGLADVGSDLRPANPAALYAAPPNGARAVDSALSVAQSSEDALQQFYSTEMAIDGDPSPAESEATTVGGDDDMDEFPGLGNHDWQHAPLPTTSASSNMSIGSLDDTALEFLRTGSGPDALPGIAAWEDTIGVPPEQRADFAGLGGGGGGSRGGGSGIKRPRLGSSPRPWPGTGQPPPVSTEVKAAAGAGTETGTVASEGQFGEVVDLAGAAINGRPIGSIPLVVLAKALPAELAFALLDSGRYQPGARPAVFQPADSCWLFKECPQSPSGDSGGNGNSGGGGGGGGSGIDVRRSAPRGPASPGGTEAIKADRWHNSGGVKGSRDMPPKQPLVRRRYGSVVSGTDGKKKGFRYHEYTRVRAGRFHLGIGPY
jgi:hypothetical protein